VSATEEREYGSIVLTTQHSLHVKKLALTLPISGGRSVGIVHLQTKAEEFAVSCLGIRKKASSQR
jgi:hypothetical protein